MLEWKRGKDEREGRKVVCWYEGYYMGSYKQLLNKMMIVCISIII